MLTNWTESPPRTRSISPHQPLFELNHRQSSTLRDTTANAPAHRWCDCHRYNNCYAALLTLNCNIKVQDIFTPSQLRVQRDCRFVFNGVIGLNEDQVGFAVSSYFFQSFNQPPSQFRLADALMRQRDR